MTTQRLTICIDFSAERQPEMRGFAKGVLADLEERGVSLDPAFNFDTAIDDVKDSDDFYDATEGDEDGTPARIG